MLHWNQFKVNGLIIHSTDTPLLMTENSYMYTVGSQYSSDISSDIIFDLFYQTKFKLIFFCTNTEVHA